MHQIFESNDLVFYSAEVGHGLGLHKPGNGPANATFFSINPLSPNWIVNAEKCAKKPTSARFSLNVSEFRNFVFESDSMTLDQQLIEWQKLSTKIPIKLFTYSGSKSYHAIISTLDTLPFEPHTAEGISGYKQSWRALRAYIESNSLLKLDESTKDPSRLTRLPGAFRGNVEQKAIKLELSRYITSAEVMELTARYAPVQAQAQIYNGPAINFSGLSKSLQLPKFEKLNHRVSRAEKWAGPENMYPALFRLTLWAIDELNPEPEAWLALLKSTVFPKIVATGYNRNLTVPVISAYNYKGIKV